MGAGRSHRASHGLPAPAIPKVFHFCWFGGEVPPPFEDFMKTWMDHHQHWMFKFWTDDSVPELRNQDMFDAAEEIAPGYEGQLRGDIARYELLWRFGGVYVDMDFECQKNIDALIRRVQCFAAWEETDVWVNNAIMGAVRQHPFLEALVFGLPDRVLHNTGRPNVITGPQYLTGVYRAFKGDVRVFPKELFYPYLWNELERGNEEFPEAYAVHHWNNARRRIAHAY